MTTETIIIFTCVLMFWLVALLDTDKTWRIVLVLILGMIAMLVWLSSLQLTFQGAIS